jgi:hypothetical protein
MSKVTRGNDSTMDFNLYSNFDKYFALFKSLSDPCSGDIDDSQVDTLHQRRPNSKFNITPWPFTAKAHFDVSTQEMIFNFPAPFWHWLI